MAWNVRKDHFSSSFGGRFIVILGENFFLWFFELASYLNNLIIHSRDFRVGG